MPQVTTTLVSAGVLGDLVEELRGQSGDVLVPSDEVSTFFLSMKLQNYCLCWKNKTQQQFYHTDSFVHCSVICNHHVQYIEAVLPSFSNSFHLQYMS